MKTVRIKSLKYMSNHLQSLIKNRLWLKIMVALVLGICFGILISPSSGFVGEDLSVLIGNWVALPGTIFLALIQMIVIPLVFCSVIMGITASENFEQMRKMGLRAVLFFIATTVIAIMIGMTTTAFLQPGSYIDSSLTEDGEKNEISLETPEIQAPSLSELPNMITNILPQHPLGSMVEQEMLQIVLFAVVFGIALLTMKSEHSKPLLIVFSAIQEVTMTVIRWSMLLAPFAVFGLITKTMIQMGVDVLLGMAIYVATVGVGLVLLLLLYLVIVLIICNRNPLQFLGHIREVLLLAFSTSSSAAVMPLSIQTAEEKLKVKSSTAQFIIPLGATINMNGTALYQGAATIFLAQVYDVNLSMAAMLLIVVTTVGASIGSPATPGVGIVILAMVLSGVGIPAAGIALILGVDRIIDMCRTAVNVAGDLTACIVMDEWN
jgi:Na+/H+-dicarboxylate symporter